MLKILTLHTNGLTVLHQSSAEIPNKRLSLPLQVITFQEQDEVFQVKLRLHNGEDASSTYRNLKITHKPRILLKAEIFVSLLLCFLFGYISHALRVGSCCSSFFSFYFLQLQPLKGLPDPEGSLSTISR